MTIQSTEKNVILIVDDTPTNLGLLFELLTDSGFKVLVAEDGESALQKVEYASLDLILLDVLMPGIDGFETCRRLKANRSTKDIPVIFMTALSDTVNKVEALNLGAVDYITKPLQPEEVLARVKIHLSIRNLTKKLQEQNLLLAEEIQQRQRKEEKIREQAALLDITSDAILVRDLCNRIIFWNKGAERLYGWKAEEAIGKDAERLLQEEIPAQLQDFEHFLARGGSWQDELYQVTKDGKEIIVSSRWTLVLDEQGKPKSILTVNTDITEKKQIETQFLRVQRMESLGVLASGIAHDLNNVLTPIMMAVQLLQLKYEDDQIQEWLSVLETNVKRGADLVKQVLSFARGYEGKRTILQVRHLILEIKKIAQQTFPKSIQLYIDVPMELWPVSGDATQLHQVFLNLCVNARDAMQNGGTLSIYGENIYIDENFARMNIEAKVGHYIAITVADTGAGIPGEIIDRIFEPFFTTKERGKGTGLGLSTAIGIIKSHGGFVKVTSDVGKGTEFKVYLPVTKENVSQEAEEEIRDLYKGHGELILVVDDEVSICEITKNILEKRDYQVLIARDGFEAIALYTEHQERINAVVVDMMMPSMDGATTIRILRQINPLVKIIAVSGLLSNHKMLEMLNSSVKTFLPKPYTSDELLKNLEMVLSGN